MVFYVTPGINADLMYVKDGRMCMVQGEPTKRPGDSAPVGDNQNIASRARDAVSFPYLYAGPGKSPVARQFPLPKFLSSVPAMPTTSG
jgi:hypothetical protein